MSKILSKIDKKKELLERKIGGKKQNRLSQRILFLSKEFKLFPQENRICSGYLHHLNVTIPKHELLLIVMEFSVSVYQD